MNRRNTLKILGGTAVGIAGLALADWKWQFVDELTHKGFFSSKEEKMIASIADTIIPEGLPPIVPMPDAKPIGALSTGTDTYLKGLFEKCYEKEFQDEVKLQLNALDAKSEKEIGTHFYKASQADRERLLLSLESSEDQAEKDFFDLMKRQTILGFTTVKEVMVNYRDYKVAPGHYYGCVDLNYKA